MRLITQDNPMQQDCVVALGIFDGVHLGHLRILNAAVKCKETHGLVPSVFTFNPETLPEKHGEPFQYIYRQDYKLKILQRFGIEAVCSPDFNTLREMDGETFCREILCRQMHAKIVMCGFDFRFGKNASCGVKELDKFGKEMGFQVRCSPAVTINNVPISSSMVRSCIRNGRFDLIENLLGRCYGVNGVVQHGAALGRKLHFRTINIHFDENQVTPKCGVYFSRVYTPKGMYWGVTNVGVRPTVANNAEVRAEAHLFGFHGNLYGQTCTIFLSRYLRPEQTFANKRELKRAIRRDVKAAKMYIRRFTDNHFKKPEYAHTKKKRHYHTKKRKG